MSDERDLERTEAFNRRQDEVRVATIRAGLDLIGEEFCVDCGERIEERRRAALPSATRCLSCQALHEKRSRR